MIAILKYDNQLVGVTAINYKGKMSFPNPEETQLSYSYLGNTVIMDLIEKGLSSARIEVLYVAIFRAIKFDPYPAFIDIDNWIEKNKN